MFWEQFFYTYILKQILPRRKSATQLRRKASNANLTVSKTLPPKDFAQNEAEETINKTQETNAKDETTEVLDENNNDSNPDAVAASIVNSTNTCKQNFDFSKAEEEAVSQPKIEFDLIPPTPIKLHRSVSRMRRQKMGNKRKLERNSLINLEFENLVFNQMKQSKFDEFAIEPKKKITKEMPLESKKANLEKEEDRDNSAKSLTWSSPLVTSPKSKFSPHLPKDASTSSECTDNSTQRNLPSLRSNANVLSVADKDCKSQDLKCIDIISQSFLESVGIKTIKSEDTLQHATTHSQTISSISGQDQLKAVKCDLNQSISSISSISTIMPSVAKTKIVDTSSYYTRIIKQPYGNNQIELKCVASQTEDSSFNDQKDDNNNVNIKARKNNIQNQPTESNKDLGASEKTFGECNTNKTPQLVDDYELQDDKISIELNSCFEEEFLLAEPFLENVNTSCLKYSNDADTRNGDEKKSIHKDLNPLEETRLKIMDKNAENFDAMSHPNRFNTEYKSLNPQQEIRSNCMDQSLQSFDAMPYSQFDTKNSNNDEYTHNKLNPMDDTLLKTMNHNIQKFDRMSYQNKLIQKPRPVNLQNSTLPKNILEKNYSFGKLNAQKMFSQQRITEQTNNFDSSFYKDAEFQDHYWMNPNLISNKSNINDPIMKERNQYDQRIFETTFDQKPRQANHISYFNQPQQYDTRTTTFENAPHISDIKESNKFPSYENNFRNNYPIQNMNNRMKQTASSGHIPRSCNYNSNHQNMHFEDTINSGNVVKFPMKQSQILSQNALPISDDTNDKLVENVTPPSVEPMRHFNHSNLAARQPLPEHYENIRRNQLLHNPEVYSECDGRYSHYRRHALENVGRFNGTNTNESFYGDTIGYCNDFDDSVHVKNQSLQNHGRGYKHMEGRILPNYIEQQIGPIKTADKINFSNQHSEAIPNNSGQFLQQNASHPYKRINRRTVENSRLWQLEEPHQMGRHPQQAVNNKNDFLLSRYFNSYSRQNSFNFNEDLLNLNHTVTSDQIHDLSPNF